MHNKTIFFRNIVSLFQITSYRIQRQRALAATPHANAAEASPDGIVRPAIQEGTSLTSFSVERLSPHTQWYVTHPIFNGTSPTFCTTL